MSIEHWQVAVDKHLLIVSLSRPDVKNAFSMQTLRELSTILTEYEHHPKIRVMVLTAHGDVFCSGADLKWMRDACSMTADENLEDARCFAKTLHQLAYFPKPIISAVPGSAYGGGIGLIAASDLVVAVEDAQFCFSEVKIGLVPAVISPYVMRKITFCGTQRYFLTAETFNAERAKTMGLIHTVTKPADFQAQWMRLAAKLSEHSPTAMMASKHLLNEIRPIDEATMEKTAKTLAAQRASEEGKEGVLSFLEKRKPTWISA